MAYPPGAMRQGPPTRPPSRPPSLEQPVPQLAVEPVSVPPPPENTWPCGCAYPSAHHTDCMWSLWEQMRANYMQTKTLMGKFMTQVDGLQTGAKAQIECECPSSCHGRDLGQAMGLQQMQGVTVPWLQPPSNTAGPSVTGMAVPDTGNYTSESRKLVEEQQRIKKSWAQFLNIFDIALDMANDVSKDRWEAARRRKERERLERQERREEERRERQERREKCAEERSNSKEEEEEADQQQQKQQQQDGNKKNKRKSAEKSEEEQEKEKRKESKRSEAKSPPGTPQRRSSAKPQSVTEDEKTEESPEPVVAEGAEGGEGEEGAEGTET